MNKEFNKWWYRKLRIIGETALPTTVIHSVKDIAEAAWEASARRRLDQYGIWGICGAYESGYGKGLDSRTCMNPYGKGTNEHEAYDHGYEVGQSKAKENTDGG